MIVISLCAFTGNWLLIVIKADQVKELVMKRV